MSSNEEGGSTHSGEWRSNYTAEEMKEALRQEFEQRRVIASGPSLSSALRDTDFSRQVSQEVARAIADTFNRAAREGG